MPWAATCMGGVIAEAMHLQQQHVAEMDATTEVESPREPWMPWYLPAAECSAIFRQAEASETVAVPAKSPKLFPASEALMKIAPMDHQLGGDAAKNRIVAG